MQERLVQLGGALDISSTESGTVVIASLPAIEQDSAQIPDQDRRAV
jgi:signal transduction histidine kinase